MDHDLTLRGFGMVLRPLETADAGAFDGEIDADFWRGMTTPLPETVDALATQFSAARADPNRVPFAVVEEATGDVVGTTSYYDVLPRRLEIGHTFYLRRVWGTHVNPAAKYLLFAHAFEERHVWRVALRCDARNSRSRAAIERLGCTYEGTLRRHRTDSDGVAADTAYFSLLDDEWPDAKRRLGERLASAGRA